MRFFRSEVKNAIMDVYLELVMRRFEGEDDIKLYLSPKQMLYIFGLYKPSTPAKQRECAWLDPIRKEMIRDGFRPEPVKQRLARNPRQSLNTHLHDLTQMGILVRRHGRYGPGLSFGINPFFYERIKDIILSEGPKGFFSEDGVIAFMRSKALRRRDLDRETREEIMKKAREFMALAIERYSQFFVRNPTAARDESNMYPLIIIDLNALAGLLARKQEADEELHGYDVVGVLEEIRRMAR